MELLRHLGEAGQLVRARRPGQQPAAVRSVAGVPAQVFEGQPARALDEAALDLADVDHRGEAVADVVDDVHPPDAVRAGEAVHLHLGRRGAVGEVLERRAPERLRVPVEALGAVEAGRRQLDPLEVRGAHQVVPGQFPVAPEDAGDALDDAYVGGVRAQSGGGHPGQAFAQLLAGVLHRPAVEVGTGAGGGGGGVGHLVGPCGGEAHLVERDAQGGGGHLQHLGVQSLAHLGAAVVDQDRAVLVDQHERAALVEGGEVEGDAELDAGDGESPLGVRVRGVERGDLAPAVGDVPVVLDLPPDGGDPFGVGDGLSVRCRLALSGAVEVALPQLHGVEAEQRRAPAHDVLDHQHALGAAEAAEGGVGDLVGPGDAAGDAGVRDPVGVVDVAERAGDHRLGQVQAPAAVRGQGGVQGLDAPVGVEADPPRGVEAVALAGHGQVLGPVEPDPDRSAGQPGAERGDGREAVRLHLLAAEAAAHAEALHGHLVAGQAEHVSDDLLRLRGVLGAALDEHLPVLVDQGQRRVRLQVEVLLVGELELAREHVGGVGEAGVDVAGDHHGPGAVEAPGGDRVPQGDQGGQFVEFHLDGLRAEACRFRGLAEHPGDRVAVEHDLVGEERFVVLHAGVVDPGHVGRGQYADHAGDGERGPGAQRGDAAAGLHDLDRVGVQHVLGAVHQVVGVERGARDVQVGALVRQGDADDGLLGTLGQVAHEDTVPVVRTYSFLRLWPSISAR